MPEPSHPRPVEAPGLEAMRRAAELVGEVTVPTPAVPLESAEDLWLWPEIHQPAGCFKVRGIYHAVATLAPEVRARGLSTVSAGNTAKALAWCGRRFGVEARALMPDHAPRTKVETVERFGGTPVLVPVDEVFRFLKQHGWEDEPYAFVHPWTDTAVLTGHASLGLELVETLPAVETVFVPVGGGGLLGGVGSALRAVRPDVRIVAVEPTGCPSLHAAVAAGHPVDVDSDTICDGVAVPYVTHEMFPLLSELADDIVLVGDDDVRATIRRLALEAHVVAEGSGALAVAAALAMPPEERGRSVALVTGGSIDAAKLAAILG